MKKELWFKAKNYGWGWIPITWQGWIVVLSFVSVLLLNGFYFSSKISNNKSPSNTDLLLFFVTIIISIIILFILCYKKGEKPSWRWGK